MAGRRSGCLLTLTSPCWIGYAIGIPLLSLAAPVLVPYLHRRDPAQFAEYRTAWLCILGITPLVAFLLVRWASPAAGRLRAPRPRGRPSPAKRVRNPRACRPGRVTGYLTRMAALVVATSAAAYRHLPEHPGARGEQAVREIAPLAGGVAVATVAVLIVIRLWDRPYVPPITVEVVRAQIHQAEKALKRINAENARMERMVAAVDRKLSAAHSRRDFATLRTMHHESYGCADSVHGVYRSVQDSHRVMVQTIRVVHRSAWQPTGVVIRVVHPKSRAEYARLRADAGGLADRAARLGAATDYHLSLVQRLNARTADLKHTIRDECGPAGENWYNALEERREAARLAEGKPV
ncbi:hypothetical protein [Paractinoplanes rishiriensis]|uniref:Uncharacterized protein n=1 Tax=Paractinoplanes rishiriensis TaxID=1050105 RepID=A0A919N2N0_9ACTN|nr:hypothetical protein [Actinoplanes rishiriensis]GIF00988.1 hypothetical protein Ari01nite_84520 [Actinoplanes rishiriensis]